MVIIVKNGLEGRERIIIMVLYEHIKKILYGSILGASWYVVQSATAVIVNFPAIFGIQIDLKENPTCFVNYLITIRGGADSAPPTLTTILTD